MAASRHLANSPAPSGPGVDPRALARGPAVWALALGQTLTYACLYYVFAALILPWQADLGWDKARFAAGPTLALLIAAVLAPVAGRLVDRGRGPEALALAPIIGAAGLAALAMSQGYTAYLLGWVVIGLACAIGLYEACFAFLVRRLGADARAGIVRVTLIAGFASTLAFPAGAVLSAEIGWRGALLVAAGALIFLATPLHWVGARMIRRQAPQPAIPSVQSTSGRMPGFRAMVSVPAFWLLGGLYALVGLNHWMMIAFLVPVFIDLGAQPAVAVLAASSVGPAQVAGRLALMAIETRVGNNVVAWATMCGFVVAAGLLAMAGGSAWILFAYTVVQGSAIGVMTILKPVLIAEIMGPEDYGTVAGAIQIPGLVALAAAPLVGANILDALGVRGLVGMSALLSVASVATLVPLFARAGREVR